ncbi:MAG: hypothetical protein WD032_07115 [Nitrospirales bacterium]
MPKAVSDQPTTEVTPDPSLEKRTRRTFSTDKKLRILTQADACKHGELGALLFVPDFDSFALLRREAFPQFHVGIRGKDGRGKFHF